MVHLAVDDEEQTFGENGCHSEPGRSEVQANATPIEN